MDPNHRSWKTALTGGLGIVVVLAVVRVVVYSVFNDQYGFHRDELQFFDDARRLAWGYVPYPPVTPAVARVARELFGPSLVGLRLLSAIAQGVAMVVAALMARDLGGGRLAQVVAGVAVAIAPMSAFSSATFMYVSFDFVWWVTVAWLVIRLLRSEDPRWWVPLGAVIGLGMMTRYTMAYWVVGLVAGVLLTGARRYLRSRWLWAGVVVSLLVFLPNLVWQLRHDFITLQFVGSIHERDIGEGRTANFLVDQLLVAANVFTIPLWIAGLHYLLVAEGGRRYRLLGWMTVATFLAFLVSQGRGYYSAGVYPVLLVAGACYAERRLATLSTRWAAAVKVAGGALLAAGTVMALVFTLAIHPIGSAGWNGALTLNGDLVEQIGWPDMVATVAGVYEALPEEQRARTGILAGNYGEAGALNLYGGEYSLPEAISGINDYWLRGYGDPPPETVILIGFDVDTARRHFADCRLVAHNTNRLGVPNEETVDHPDVFLCGPPRRPWPEFWADFHWFG